MSPGRVAEGGVSNHSEAAESGLSKSGDAVGKIAGLLLDLDGTVYRGRHAVPGAPELIARLEHRSFPFLYVTNRSNRTPERICQQLRGYGLPCRPEQVLTSALASARHLGGGKIYLIGGEGLHRALDGDPWNVVDETTNRVDAVVVGIDPTVGYYQIDHAARLIRDHGARFIATNPDKVTHDDHGLVAGNGAIVAAIAAAAGKEPEMIGKPSPIILHQAREILGLPANELLLIGDNLETDIRGGLEAGITTALLLTGVSSREDIHHLGIHPHQVFEGFTELGEFLGL